MGGEIRKARVGKSGEGVGDAAAEFSSCQERIGARSRAGVGGGDAQDGVDVFSFEREQRDESPNDDAVDIELFIGEAFH